MNWRKKISRAREFVREHPECTKASVARAFGIARGTLYLRSPTQVAKDKLLLEKVLEVRRDHPHYGHRRIALTLGKSKNTILRIMRKYGLKPRRRRKKPVYRSGNGGGDIPNRVRRLSPICPNAIWAGDFTYLSYHGIFLYLATVMDLFTREIVGWKVAFHHSADLVVGALDDAMRRRAATPLTFHSDQGSEYDSDLCRSWLLAHSILPSRSVKAHPWENGRQEAFFRTFKEELGSMSGFVDTADLIAAIHHQIHYYNTERIHGVLKTTPVECYRRACEKMPNLVFRAKKVPAESV